MLYAHWSIDVDEGHWTQQKSKLFAQVVFSCFVYYKNKIFDVLSLYFQWSNNDYALTAWMTANLSLDMKEWADHSGKSVIIF